MSIERCGWSDLPIMECDHCPAHTREAARIAACAELSSEVDPNTTAVISGPQIAISRSGRDIWPSVPTPIEGRFPLRLVSDPDDGTCACGQPLRDNATGCDDCVLEMERILGDVPWLAEQLDIAVSRQRAKSGAGRGDDGLPWNDKASDALHALRNELSTTIRMLVEDHRLDWPADDITAMSRWLMRNVRLLSHDDGWTDTLRNLRHIEGDALAIVDNPPALLFLGWCTSEMIVGEGLTVRIEECGGPVYARDGRDTGRCRMCQNEYGVKESRKALTDMLDDKLVTPAEIAKLSIYLGIEQPRERIRNLVTQWSRRDRILPKGARDGVPTYRWGDVSPLLSATFETREKSGT